MHNNNEIITDSKQKGLENGNIKGILERIKGEELNSFRETLALTEKQTDFLKDLKDQLIIIKKNIEYSSEEWIKNCKEKREEEKTDEINKLETKYKTIEDKLDSTRTFISDNCNSNSTIAVLSTFLISVFFIYSNSLLFLKVDMHDHLAWAVGASLGIAATFASFSLGKFYKYKKTAIDSLEQSNDPYQGYNLFLILSIAFLAMFLGSLEYGSLVIGSTISHITARVGIFVNGSTLAV